MNWMEQAIEKNRKREVRFDKAERMLHRLRQRIFDYIDAGPAKEAQADRLITRCKARAMPRWEARYRACEERRMEVHFL
jgi:hypothetical protein